MSETVREKRGMKRSREPESKEEVPQDGDPSPSASPSPGPSGAAASPAPAQQRAHKIVAGNSSDSDSDSNSNSEQQEAAAAAAATMKCSMPPHREALAFKSYADYEIHYRKAHTNRCVECGRNLPSEHLLSVHIEECHDVFAALRRERGEHTYTCFVETCDRKCRTPQKRRMHLIDKHQYPKNYFFAVTREGVDGRRSMLLEGGHGHRRRASSSAHNGVGGGGGGGAPRRRDVKEGSESPPTPMEGIATESKPAPNAPSTPAPPTPTTTTTTTNKASPTPTKQPEQQQGRAATDVDIAMEDLSGAMSALRFVPSSIRFGHGRGRSGFSRQ